MADKVGCVDGRDDGDEDGLLVGLVDTVGLMDGQLVGKGLGWSEGELVGSKDGKFVGESDGYILIVAKDPSGFINFDSSSSLDPKNIVDTKTASIVPSTRAVAIPKNATLSHLIVVVL